MKKSNNHGFTLAELLIVVAIIAVLVAISIPIFTGQLEKAKQATDLANMRSAKAAAVAEYLTENMGGEYKRYYDAGKGRMSDSIPEGYGKSSTNASEFASGLNASGVPNKDGNASYITVTIDKDGTVSLSWGGISLSTYNSLNAHINSDKFYWHSTERKESFNQLLSIDNNKRKTADLEILNALASTLEGKTVAEMESILGSTRYSQTTSGGSTILFKYGQDGGGSIRIFGNDTNDMNYLSEMGYTTEVYSNPGGIDTFGGQGSNNYVKNYLFTSNEMVGTEYKQYTEKTIKIKYQIENGVIKNTVVWVDGLNGYTSGN